MGPERPFTGSKPSHTITLHNEMDQEAAHGKIYTVAQCLLNRALLVFLIAEHLVCCKCNRSLNNLILIIHLLRYSTCSIDLQHLCYEVS